MNIETVTLAAFLYVQMPSTTDVQREYFTPTYRPVEQGKNREYPTLLHTEKKSRGLLGPEPKPTIEELRSKEREGWKYRQRAEHQKNKHIYKK